MIKFFRKIRQKLVSDHNFSKYLLYAIGEIILVVIGILIAIQLNDFNENNKERNREISFLQKLKDDLVLDVQELSQTDSILAVYQSNQDEAYRLFLKAKTAEDIMKVDSLMDFSWNNITVNRKTYDEMLNTTGIYIIKNKVVLNQISDHYALIEKYRQFFKEINEDSRELRKYHFLYPFDFLIKHYKNPLVDKTRIDTMWIGDYNSPTYLGLARFYRHVIGAVTGNKRRYIHDIVQDSNELIEVIDNQLNQ